MAKTALDLYNKYFLDRQFERLDLFQFIADKFQVQRVLYAGSFVHITPSFVFPNVVYVDNDRHTERFFNASEVYNFIDQRKRYLQDAYIQFHFADYRDAFDEECGSFDLLISQYAGFVGQYCKPYLRKDGLLLANDSHGDAGMAALDADYQLIAVFSFGNGKYRMSESNLADYFVPKSSALVTKEYLKRLGKGIRYKKTSCAYLFRKIL